MAYAGALFADACLRGLNGDPNVEEYSFVESNVVPELAFFSSKVKLGPNGARPRCSLSLVLRAACRAYFEVSESDHVGWHEWHGALSHSEGSPFSLCQHCC